MGNIQIKAVPSDVHDELRRRAQLQGTTIRDYVLRLIEKDQVLPTREEWRQRLRTRPPIESELSSAELVDSGRQERDEQLVGDRRRR